MNPHRRLSDLDVEPIGVRFVEDPPVGVLIEFAGEAHLHGDRDFVGSSGSVTEAVQRRRKRVGNVFIIYSMPLS